MKWKEMPENGKRLVMILTFVFIMFFVSGCMYGKAYAAITTFDDVTCKSYLNDTYKYYYTYDTTLGYEYLLVTQNKLMVNNNQVLVANGMSSMYRIENGKIVTWILGDDGTSTPLTTIVKSKLSNYDILRSDGTVFFSLQPILVGQVQPQSLTPVLKQVVLILPTLLTCLIGYLALRKALQALQQILHQA